jgi:hypothetical protein
MLDFIFGVQLMDILQFLFPDLKPSQRRVNITHVESQVATVLVANDYDMSDADIISNITHYNSRWAPTTPIDGQAICDLRKTLKDIMFSPSPALAALERYCSDNYFTLTFDRVLIGTQSQFYTGKDSVSFAGFEDIIKASADNGQNIFTMLKYAKMALNKEERSSALTLCIENAKAAYVKSVGEKIKFDPTVEFDWKALKSKFGFTDLDCQVIRYVIWGMKRRLLFGTYTRRICLYIYSSQQALGKTELAKAIYSPLEGLSQVMLPESFNDVNNFSARECYGPVIDDIDKSKDGVVSNIKNTLTAESTSVRVFHSQRSTTVVINAWPILTSNKRVENVFSDTTGNTRYHEIEITGPVFNSIKGIDWTGMWRSVDENKNTLWSQEDWDTFMNKAEEQRTRSYLDDFLDAVLLQNKMETDLEAATLEYNEEYTPYRLFKVFTAHSEEQVRKFALTPNKLANALRNTKFKDYDLDFDVYATGIIKSIKFLRRIVPTKKVDIDRVFEEVGNRGATVERKIIKNIGRPWE